MRVPLSWLHTFVRPDLPVERLAEVLTMGGLVVEAIHRPSAGTRGVVVSEVRSVAKVEGSDKLYLVEAFDGQQTLEVVCGASNYAAGDKVAWAQPGSTLPGPDPSQPFEIGRKKLFGVVSNGMLASTRELGVGDDHSGIWVLDDDAPVGADLTEWLDLDDPVMELELNPDRGYAQSIIGVARDVAALTGSELALPDVPDMPCSSADPPDPGVPVDILDPERCPRFDARRIAGVTVAPSPAWLQRRLFAAGVRPISNIVDATNHTMIEVGNPIHAYDVALLRGPRLEIRVARPGETLVTLDGVQRRLDPDDLVIADAGGPVALAGVMGGEGPEIHTDTRDVLLETANFTAATVLRTARRHQLFTEGSKRWEKQVPPESVPLAAGRCAALIAELADGRVIGASDDYPRTRGRDVIRLRTQRARRRLGMDVDARRQAELLRSIACTVDGDGAPGAAVTATDDVVLEVVPPAYRPDLRIEEDLYEEIARLEGYERIPERVASAGRVGGRAPEHEAQTRVRHALAGGGWTEVMPHPFIAPEDFDRLGLAADDHRRRAVALTNPLSKEESVLHTTLLPGVLRVVRRNVNRQIVDLSIFTTGRAFLQPTADEPGAPGGPATVPDPPTLPAEPLLLGFAACGDFEHPRHDRAGRAVDVFDLLGAVDLARLTLGLPPLQARATDEPPYHPGRAARLSLDGVDVGVVGELHPRVIAAFDVPARTLAGELRLDRLTAGGALLARGRAPSPLPALRFDVAVVTDASVPAQRVADAVAAGAGERLTSCTLFDVYEGPSVGEGRRSLAYRVVLDDAARQLTDADEAAAIDAIERTVVERVDGALRR